MMLTLHEGVRRSKGLRLPAIVLASLAVLITAAHFIKGNQREIFMFRQPSTRILAEGWVLENVPMDFQPEYSVYAAMNRVAERRSPETHGSFLVVADRRYEIPKNHVPIAAFFLERHPLPVFINYPTTIYLPIRQPEIAAPYQHPFPSPIGSAFSRSLLFPENPSAFRDSRIFPVPHGEKQKRYLVLSREHDSIAVLIEAPVRPTRIRIKSGKYEQTAQVSPGIGQLIEVPLGNPKVFQNQAPAFFPLTITSEFGDAIVSLGVTDDQRFALRQRAGGRADGASLPDLQNPTLRVLSSLSDDTADSGTRITLPERASYGIDTACLNRLPFLHWGVEKLEATSGFAVRHSKEDGAAVLIPYETDIDTIRLTSSPVSLAPGIYRIWLELEGIENNPADLLSSISACLRFRGDVVIQNATDFRVNGSRVEARLSHSRYGVPQVQWSFQPGIPVAIRATGIRPDTDASYEALASLLRSLGKSAPEPDAVRAQNLPYLLAEARRLSKNHETDKAVSWAKAAATSSPASRAARDIMQDLEASSDSVETLVRLPEHATFKNGGVLRGGYFSVVHSSRELALHFVQDWSQIRHLPELKTVSVWVHIRNKAGKTVAQGDYPLYAALEQPNPAEYLLPPRKIPLQTDLPPGEYTVVSGLWQPASGKRIRLKNQETFGSKYEVEVFAFSKN